jgi:hypothetical protein
LVKVRNAASPEISRYLKKFRLSTDQEKMQMGKSGSLLDMLMKGLATLGLIFSMLALVMFATNFRLVMAEAEPDIRLLIELGYAHRRIAFQLLFWFGIFILLIFCGAVFLFLKGQALLGQAITGQGFGADPGIFGGTCLLAGFAFVFMVVLWNGILILNQLRKIA